MTRIATFGSSQIYLSRVMNIQQRLHDLSIQVATEKKSQNYTGIASDTNRLLNFENERALADQYLKNNTMATTKLKTANTALDAIRRTMTDFRDHLNGFIATQAIDRFELQRIQEWAYRGITEMQAYLGTTVDGNFIFSGGRVTSDPVEMPTASFSQFQAFYDGADNTYPTTRTAHLLDLTTSSATTGAITFDAATGTLHGAALTDNELAKIPVGSRITIGDTSGTPGANDGKVFTVRDVVVDGTGTTLSLSRLTNEGPVAGVIKFTDATMTDHSVSTNLTFSPGADTITIDDASGLTVGQVFTVSGTASNNGGYEVQSIVPGSPATVTIKGVKVASEPASTTVTVSASSWYKGDNITLEQRIDRTRTIDIGIYASDPAFEKAFRAMGLLAQGAYGTAGGLENNMERIAQAKFLIDDALRSPSSGNPPFGPEIQTDLDSLESRVGINLSVLNYQDEKLTIYKGLLETRIVGLENVDKTEAITMLLSDQRALEAAFQAMAKVRQMSLLQFL